MEFCHSYPFVAFVVLTVDQIVGDDDGPLFQQIRGDIPFFSKNVAIMSLWSKRSSSCPTI